MSQGRQRNPLVEAEEGLGMPPGWWTETKIMVNEGSRHFWSRKGRVKPAEGDYRYKSTREKEDEEDE